MANYKATPSTLLDAVDTLQAVFTSLNKWNDHIATLPKVTQPPELQLATNQMRHHLVQFATHVKDLGTTLQTLADIYTQAEQNAFGDAPARGQHGVAMPMVPVIPPQVSMPRNILFTSQLIIPEWLQLATLNYQTAVKNHY